jgi:flagellar motor switch protein FliM
VASDRVLSQEEIDSVFRSLRQGPAQEDPGAAAQTYDFRRPDRIAKDQLRAIHLLHENFARSLSSSLSAFLRAYVAVNLVSVEQLSFLEFSQCLPSPSCIISLGMRPYDGNSLLEINPTLVFPILEMLLGGSGKPGVKVTREITEIEQAILETVYRIILNDLRNAWQAVTPIDFVIESHETEPQMLQILAPNEAVVAVSMEARIGDNTGMMNIGIPSIIVKMLRQKFDQQWSMRRSHSTLSDQERMLKLVRAARVCLDLRLQGQTMRVDELLRLEPGHVLTFDHPATKLISLLMNGRLKYRAAPTTTGQKRAVEFASEYVELDYAPIKDYKMAASG